MTVFSTGREGVYETLRFLDRPSLRTTVDRLRKCHDDARSGCKTAMEIIPRRGNG